MTSSATDHQYKPISKSLLSGKCRKSPSWTKTTLEKVALETPLCKLGSHNFYAMFPMNS